MLRRFFTGIGISKNNLIARPKWVFRWCLPEMNLISTPKKEIHLKEQKQVHKYTPGSLYHLCICAKPTGFESETFVNQSGFVGTGSELRIDYSSYYTVSYSWSLTTCKQRIWRLMRQHCGTSTWRPPVRILQSPTNFPHLATLCWPGHSSWKWNTLLFYWQRE